MQEIDPLVPDSVRFPLEDAVALAGVRMFPTTFAYMAALAVLQGYTEIRITGVELSATEYQYQKEGYLFWFGFLRGRLGAANVDSAILHQGVNIFETPLYGYEGNFALGADYFAERARSHDGAWQAADRNLKNLSKAIRRAVEHCEFEYVRTLTLEFQTAAMNAGELAGALAEAERYQAFGDRYADRGGFEAAAATGQQAGEEGKPLTWHYGGQIEYVWNVWKQTKAPQAANQLLLLIDKMSQCAYDTGAQLGKYKENLGYIVKYDGMVQANGGTK
jgi:hypothetical protein